MRAVLAEVVPLLPLDQEWQASPTAVAFYERLGYKADPCPQPAYPFLEITLPVTAGHPHTC